MVSKNVPYQINQRLIEFFKLPDQPFAGKSILAVGDLYQSPPVNAKPVYACTFDFTWVTFQLTFGGFLSLCS